MLTRLLTIAPLLLCPLLMLVCMWAMRGMGNRANSQGPARAGQDEVPTAARVAQLERELAELRGRFPQASTLRRSRRRHGPTQRAVHATARRCSRVDGPAMMSLLRPGRASP
jgi:type VI protein secretion system component VasK